MTSIISYAQNFEDIILWRALKDVKNGYYVDIGSEDPITYSVSYLFSQNYWKGLSVEPTDQHFNSFKQQRPQDDIIKAFVSDTSELVDFYVFADTGLSTADLKIAEKHKKLGFNYSIDKIKTITLQDIWNLTKTKDIHWLKIDVEGYEQQILKGWNNDVRPWVLLIESCFPISGPRNTKEWKRIEVHEEWEHLILSKGYEFVYADGLNRFYLHKDHLRLKPFFQYPPNVIEDDFVIHETLIKFDKRAKDAEAAKHQLEELTNSQNTLLNEKVQALAAHETIVKEQQVHVDTLQAALNEATESHNALLNEKAQTLTAHETIVKEQQVHIDTLQAALNEAAQSQNALLNEKAQALAAHEAIIKEKQAHVDTLQAALKETAQSQNALLSEKVQALAAHEAIIKEQQAHVDTLQAALKEAAQSQKNLLNEKVQDLATHETIVKEQQAHVDTLQVALKEAAQSQKTLLNEKAQALAAHEAIIKEQQAHVDTLRAALKEAAQSQKTLLNEKVQDLATHEAIVKEQQAHVDTLQVALKEAAQSQKNLLNEKAQALAAHEAIIKEQQAHVDTLQTTLKEAAQSQKNLLNEKVHALATHKAIIKEKQTHVDILQAAVKEAAKSHKALLNEKAQALASHEVTIKEQQAHVDTLQTALKVSNRHIDELVGQITLTKSYAEALDEQFKKKVQALSDNEAALVEQQIQSQKLQNEYEAAETKIAELNASSHHWWTIADQLTRELQTAETKIAELNASSHHWWTVADQLTREVQTAETKIAELNACSYHWWTVADQLTREVQAVYNSISWKLTWPIREFDRIVKEGIYRIKGEWGSFLRILKDFLANKNFTQEELKYIDNWCNNQIKKNRELNIRRKVFDHGVGKKLRIVLDLQGVQTSSGTRGIGRYSLSLAKALLRNPRQHEFIIALNGVYPESIDQVKMEFDGLIDPKNIFIWQGIPSTAWCNVESHARAEVSEIMREYSLQTLQPDIIHISSLFEGLHEDASVSVKNLYDNVPTAVTVYDLIPYLKPDDYLKTPQSKHLYMRQINNLKRSDLLLAISQSTSQEIIDNLLVPANKVVTISSDTNEIFKKIPISTETSSTIRAKHQIKHKFILTVGVISPDDNRKNLKTLVQAFALLPKNLQQEYQLVVVGHGDSAGREGLQNLTKELSIQEENIIIAGHIPDNDLIVLYNLTDLLVLPSLHEGFGLPLLEAMRCGAAVIGSNCSSIPEVIGFDQALFDPLSSQSIAEKMVEALTNIPFREKLIDHGTRQHLNFSWERVANITLDSFEALSAKCQPIQPSAQKITQAFYRALINFKTNPIYPENKNNKLLKCLSVILKPLIQNSKVRSLGSKYINRFPSIKSFIRKVDIPAYSLKQNLTLENEAPVINEVPVTNEIHVINEAPVVLQDNNNLKNRDLSLKVLKIYSQLNNSIKSKRRKVS
ncbi:MAG: FkbM family methyltransferase [Alphaproteobacteria bacterium]|nr:FkbM family methyltransferase [Alphaproteobacteria bacterium]